MENEKISVVIPLFNKAPHILRAINSVLSQTVLPNEIIVVDDGSTDDGGAIVASLRNQSIRLITQSNMGVSEARNRGINESKSDLIAFLDADDEWKPKFLETILRLRRKFPHCGCYATGYEILEKGKVSYPHLKGIPSQVWEGVLTNYFITALGDPSFFTSSVAIPKSVCDKVGGFPKNIKLGEDLYVWYKIALSYEIAYSSSIHVIYQRDAINRACMVIPQTNPLFVVDKAKADLESGLVPNHIRQWVFEMIYKYTIEFAGNYIKSGNPARGRELLMECQTTKFNKSLWRKWYYASFLPYQAFEKLYLLKHSV